MPPSSAVLRLTRSTGLTRGGRAATPIKATPRESILAATTELLGAMVEANGIHIEDVASAFFTASPDLNAEFPALAARQMGWTHVALLCGHEMNVPGSLPLCLRILLHVNTEKRASDIVHVYLHGARVLRPDFEDRGPGQGEGQPGPERTTNKK